MDDQDVFDDDSKEEVEAQAETETEELETGEEVEAQADTNEEPPASEGQTVPLSAMIAIRRELQEAKAQLEERSKAPDPVTDPDGYEAHRQAESLTDKIALTEDFAKDAYEDYDQMKDVFLSLVATQGEDGQLQVTDASLYQKFISAPNPAKFAYNHAKSHQDFLEKSSDDYEKKIEQRILEKLAKDGKLAVDVADLPDFTNAADVLSNNSLEEKGDPNRIDAFDE